MHTVKLKKKNCWVYNLAMAVTAVERTLRFLGLTLTSLVLLVGAKGIIQSMLGNEAAVKAMQDIICYPVVIAGVLGMAYLWERGNRSNST